MADFSDYNGCWITLISRSEVRYEGILDYVDLNRSVMRLKNVTCYGTEGRQKNGPEIRPDPNVYEYRNFQGSEINDLKIKYRPLPKIGKQIYDDPAAIQVQYTNVWNSQSPPSPLVGGRGTLTDPILYQNTIGRPFRQRHSLPEQNTIGHPFRHPYSSPRQNTIGRQSLTNATHEPNHIETPFQYSHPLPMQNTIGRPSLPIPTHEPNHNETSPHISQCSTSTESSERFVPHLSLLPPIGSEQYPTSHVSSPSAHTTVTTSISSLPPVMPETGDNKAQITGQSVPNTASSFEDSTSGSPLTLPPSSLGLTDPLEHQAHLLPSPRDTPTQITGQSVPNTASSFGDSTSGPPLILPPSSLAPPQLSESGANVPSTMRPCDDPRDLVTLMHLPHNSLELTDPLEHQAPLLPSPRETPTQQFTEDSDFQAMNEESKKDELLGSPGKALQGNLSEVVEENKTGVRVEEDTSYRAKLMFEPATSSNTLASRSRSGSRRRLNKFIKYTEPTGNLQQTGNPDLGGDGAGRGSNNQRRG